MLRRAMHQHFKVRDGGSCAIPGSKRAACPQGWSGWWPTVPRKRASSLQTLAKPRRSSVLSWISKPRLLSARSKKKSLHNDSIKLTSSPPISCIHCLCTRSNLISIVTWVSIPWCSRKRIRLVPPETGNCQSCASDPASWKYHYQSHPRYSLSSRPWTWEPIPSSDIWYDKEVKKYSLCQPVIFCRLFFAEAVLRLIARHCTLRSS